MVSVYRIFDISSVTFSIFNMQLRSVSIDRNICDFFHFISLFVNELRMLDITSLQTIRKWSRGILRLPARKSFRQITTYTANFIWYLYTRYAPFVYYFQCFLCFIYRDSIFRLHCVKRELSDYRITTFLQSEKKICRIVVCCVTVFVVIILEGHINK